MRVHDWCKFHIGNYVIVDGDERHVARITRIDNSAYADLTFIETGWHSIAVPCRFLTHAPKESYQ